MRGWRECKLGDVAEIQTGPFGSQLHAFDYIPIGIPSIMPTNIGNRLEIDTREIACIKESDAKRLERYLVKEGDIVYSRRGDVEKCAFIGSMQSGYLCGTGCLRIRFNASGALPKFCAYFLSTDDSKGYIAGHAVGTTMPNLNSSILAHVPMQLPPLPEQRAISAVLSSLDDKIDLLHRQNKTLEGMAEAVWRKIFVEDAEVAWKKIKTGDVITVKGGTTPSSKCPEFWNGNIPWTTPRDLSDQVSVYLYDTERKITAAGLSQIGSGLLPVGSVLLSSRAPIGYLVIAGIEVAINQGYIGILCDKGVSNYFMFLWIRQNMEMIIGAANGSTFLEISKSVFKDLDFLLPSKDALTAFDKKAVLLFAKIRNNQIQIRVLTKLRDMLLPKLMSGEIRVKM